jgi:hypothetical protein
MDMDGYIKQARKKRLFHEPTKKCMHKIKLKKTANCNPFQFCNVEIF